MYHKNATNYIFLAIKIKNIYYAVLINTEELEDINYNEITIISVKIRLTIDCYKGTILDGKLANLNGCSTYIINDVYELYGKEIKYHKKSDILDDFLEKSIIDSLRSAALKGIQPAIEIKNVITHAIVGNLLGKLFNNFIFLNINTDNP